MKDASLVFTELLPRLTTAMPAVGEETGFALPGDTLNCLRQIVSTLGMTKVFEFGSGQSTKVFLNCGCQVTSIEDSEYWQAETIRTIDPAEISRLKSVAQPLEVVWSGIVPFKGWKLSREMITALQEADLVLIDSPALPPFREYALIQSLTHASNALIVLDDAKIPTLQRFCERFARRNPELMIFHTKKDHGLCFLARHDSKPVKLDFRRDLLETVKAWRRYMILSRVPDFVPPQ